MLLAYCSFGVALRSEMLSAGLWHWKCRQDLLCDIDFEMRVQDYLAGWACLHDIALELSVRSPRG